MKIRAKVSSKFIYHTIIFSVLPKSQQRQELRCRWVGLASARTKDSLLAHSCHGEGSLCDTYGSLLVIAGVVVVVV